MHCIFLANFGGRLRSRGGGVFGGGVPGWVRWGWPGLGGFNVWFCVTFGCRGLAPGGGARCLAMFTPKFEIFLISPKC